MCHVLVFFFVFCCLARGGPGGRGNFEKSKKLCFFEGICLGTLFAQSARITNFRAHTHQQQEEQRVEKQPPRREEKGFKHHRFLSKNGTQNRAEIASERLLAPGGRKVATKMAPKSLLEAPDGPGERSARDRRHFDAGKFGARGPWGGLARAVLKRKNNHQTFAEDLTRLRPRGPAHFFMGGLAAPARRRRRIRLGGEPRRAGT